LICLPTTNPDLVFLFPSQLAQGIRDRFEDLVADTQTSWQDRKLLVIAQALCDLNGGLRRPPEY
jgi:hypothetical protein